jgi:hypothetical protein
MGIMHPYPAPVLPFPTAPRDRRAHLLRIAAAAAPLLEAVVAEGNATMALRFFEALGALSSSSNADPITPLDAIRLRQATILPLDPARPPRHPQRRREGGEKA